MTNQLKETEKLQTWDSLSTPWGSKAQISDVKPGGENKYTKKDATTILKGNSPM